MANENKYEVKVEKLIAKPQAEVFKAISEGRLFANCSADSTSMQIDFRKGGKYRIEWKSYGFYQHGEFLEVVPSSRIVFTWNQNAMEDDSLAPDTRAEIDLEAKGDSTLVKVRHTGFATQELADNHNQGWTSGIADMGREMIEGVLNMSRWFKDVPVQKLYEYCKTPQNFFGSVSTIIEVDFGVGGQYRLNAMNRDKIIKGKYLEIEPNKKIMFTWENERNSMLTHSTKVTLEFDTDDEGGSYLTLIHEDLNTEELQKGHRTGWEIVTNNLLKTLVT